VAPDVVFFPNEDRSRSAFPLAPHQKEDGRGMAEILPKEIEIPLVEVQTTALVTAADTDWHAALAAQDLEPPLQDALVTRR
jgi:hypothetical protein